MAKKFPRKVTGKVPLVFTVFLLFTLISNAAAIAKFKQPFKRPFLVALDHERIYIYDTASLYIHVFSQKGSATPTACTAVPLRHVRDIAPKICFFRTLSGGINKKDSRHLFKFGGKGEGPAEFKWINNVNVYSDHIFVSSGGKISYFSLDGALEKEIKTEYASSTYFPLGENFVCKKFQDPSGRTTLVVKLLDTNLKELKARLAAFEIVPSFKPGANNKTDALVVNDFFGYKTDGDRLYIANTRNGFYFGVFDTRGEKLYEINRKYKKCPVKREHKEMFMQMLQKTVGQQRFERAIKKYNYIYPDFFPAYSNFTVSGGKIYVRVYPVKDEQQEMLVLDRKGELLKKAMVPVINYFVEDFCIYKGNYFYLMENEETEEWELHEVKIFE
jgi:hypothetical protein